VAVATGQSGNDRVRSELAQVRQDKKAAEASLRRSQRENTALREQLRRADAEARTLRAERAATELELVLLRGMRRDPAFDWDAKQWRYEPPPLDLGADAAPRPVPVWEAFLPPETALVTVLGSLPGAERVRQRRVAAAKQRYAEAVSEHEHAEAARRERVRRSEREHAERVAEGRRKAEAHNRDWQQLREGVRARDPQCVARLLYFALQHLPLPAGFPREAGVTCSPDAQEADVRVELPPVDVVPPVSGYAASAEVDEPAKVRRSDEEVAALHRSVVGQVALLQLRELFGADPQLRRVRFTGCVGGAEHVVVDVQRPAFVALGLGATLDPEACLGALGARRPG
jgi:restriction system protein